MKRLCSFLTFAYHSDSLRPVVAALLVALGFVLAAATLGPVMF